VRGGNGACFCSQGTSFIGCRRVRGTGLLSGYKFILVQDYSKGHWRVRGTGDYKCVFGAGAKAKTVTSPLIIPTVLVAGFILSVLKNYKE